MTGGGSDEPPLIQTKMKELVSVEMARWWAQIIIENLLTCEYTTTADNETHFKIAAIQRLIERNEELENALFEANKAKEAIARAIGAVL